MILSCTLPRKLIVCRCLVALVSVIFDKIESIVPASQLAVAATTTLSARIVPSPTKNCVLIFVMVYWFFLIVLTSAVSKNSDCLTVNIRVR